MKYLLTALLLLSTSVVSGAPFLVSDPAPAPTAGDTITCVWQEGTNPAVSTPLAVYPATQTGPGCKIELATFTAGTHNLNVWFHSALWGTDSAQTPFVLQKPSAGGTGPATLRITP